MSIIFFVFTSFITVIISIMFGSLIPGGTGDTSILLCLSLLNATIVTGIFLIIKELRKIDISKKE